MHSFGSVEAAYDPTTVVLYQASSFLWPGELNRGTVVQIGETAHFTLLVQTLSSAQRGVQFFVTVCN